MKWFVTVVVCLTVIISHGTAMSNDSVNEAAARENALRRLKDEYTSVTHKEPTLANLLKSLTIQNAQGEKLMEVVDALQLIVSEKDKMKSDAIIKEIMACYDNNPYWLVRTICADVLVRIEKPTGIELSRKILRDPSVCLEAKLCVAQNLVAVKVLMGYPVLREGLKTPIDYQRKQLALPLLDAFAVYDGAVYGEQGEKIDIASLLAETRKSAQAVVDDLAKAEAKYGKKPSK